jgi:hypothetical protein
MHVQVRMRVYARFSLVRHQTFSLYPTTLLNSLVDDRPSVRCPPTMHTLQHHGKLLFLLFEHNI